MRTVLPSKRPGSSSSVLIGVVFSLHAMKTSAVVTNSRRFESLRMLPVLLAVVKHDAVAPALVGSGHCGLGRAQQLARRGAVHTGRGNTCRYGQTIQQLVAMVELQIF